MRTKDKYTLGFVAGVLVPLGALLPVTAGTIDWYQVDFVLYSIKQSWQEILLLLILIVFVVYGKDLLRIVLLFFQKNLFDYLPKKHHIWGNLGIGTITGVLLVLFVAQIYEISKLRGAYYYKLHRDTYEQRVFQRIQKLEYTGYTEKALVLYQKLRGFSSSGDINSQLISKINQLKVSMLLSGRYYEQYRQANEPLTLQKLKWLWMARWLNPEDSEIASSFEQRIEALRDADHHLGEFWEAAIAGDTTMVGQIMESYGWYISSYRQPDWFTDKPLVINSLMEKVMATTDSLQLFAEIRTYWDWGHIQSSVDYLASLESGKLLQEDARFDKRAFRRYRLAKDEFKIHQVEPGDYIASIARKYRVSRSKLIYDNLLEDPDKIYPGDQLLIPVRAYQKYGSQESFPEADGYNSPQPSSYTYPSPGAN